MVMPPVDNQTLLEEELARRGPGIAPRFAETFSVDVRPETHGHWERLPGGESVWRLRIRSADAHSLNLGFTEYYMPPGGSLILYAPDQRQVMGPFTPADNEAHQQLWTPVLDGDELVVEVRVPNARRDELQLNLTSINHDFLGFNSVASGSCNLDVICGEEDGWAIVDLYRDIIQSVGVYGFNGNTFCTGFLVNNARQDCRPYFMVAYHCGVNAGNAPSMVVYWNYQNSTCRQPNSPASGGPGDGQLNDFNSGATYRSGYAPSDFVLVELDDPVSETADAFFSGWTAKTDLPADTTICIHHPSTDEKRISFEFGDTYLGNWGSGSTPVPSGNHIIVPDWDIGTTEGGSSGSPLFNRHKQVVGQLHGGAAACGNNAYDSYGWFHTSWEGGGSATTRLKDWLDPDDTGIEELDGEWQQNCGFFVDPLIADLEICAPEEASYDLAVSQNFENPVTIDFTNLPAGFTADFSANPAAPGDTVTLTLTGTGDVTAGAYTVIINSTDGVTSDESELFLSILDAVPAPVALTSPADGEEDVSTYPTLAWDELTENTVYELEIATTPDFAAPLLTVSDLGDPVSDIAALSPLTTYYWRVRAFNACGAGEWSVANSFTTSRCAAGFADDLPVAISSSNVNTVESTFEFSTPGLIDTIRVTDVDIAHSWIGDLEIFLTAPDGTVLTLVDRPGLPATGFGCSEDNLLITFDDLAPLSAADLEATCNVGPYAIEGVYQPIDPLSTLQGLPAAGIWTLTVTDNFAEDGGAINDWGLEICTIDDLSITPINSDIELCVGATATFDLAVGGAFAGPVELTASGLPAGATAIFSANPAPPGQLITVTIENINAAGSYLLDIDASDGEASATTAVDVTVAPLPDAPALVIPADGQTGVPLNAFLDWSAAANAGGYLLQVGADPDLQDLIFEQSLNNTNFTLANLDFGATYYWRIMAENDCGQTPSTVSSFTTLIDASVAVTPNGQTVCNSEDPVFTMSVGGGFSSPVVITYTVSPAVDLPIDFDVDPNNVTPGATVTATLPDLTGLSADVYTIVFEATDGSAVSTAEVMLEVETPPAIPGLAAPAPDQVLLNGAPTFEWNAADGSNAYRLEIATDPQFNDIVRSVVVDGESHTLTDALTPGDYFWRVTGLNDCGGSTSDQRTFRIDASNTNDLAGRTVRFDPNPTQGIFNIRLSSPLPGDLEAEVFAMNGRLIVRKAFGPSATLLTLDLSFQPGGVYLVRLRHQNAVLYRRVVVH